MIENSSYSLLTFLKIGDNLHIVDKELSDSEETLLDEAERRKAENSEYVFIIMKYNMVTARIL